MTERNGELYLPYPKHQITSAPGVDIDGQLTPDEEAVLFAHYGMDYWQGAAGEPHDQPSDQDRDQDGDDAMTRSEEELRVGTAQRERGWARLRKWVETDTIQQTVPLQREQVAVVGGCVWQGSPAAGHLPARTQPRRAR